MCAPPESVALMECRAEALCAHRASGATFGIRPLTWLSGTLTCVNAGLCDTCAHQKLIKSGRGSTFSMCLRHRTDERFPKYPRLPVQRCPGYERRELSGSR
jgi:hypothetical protein